MRHLWTRSEGVSTGRSGSEAGRGLTEEDVRWEAGSRRSGVESRPVAAGQDRTSKPICYVSSVRPRWDPVPARERVTRSATPRQDNHSHRPRQARSRRARRTQRWGGTAVAPPGPLAEGARRGLQRLLHVFNNRRHQSDHLRFLGETLPIGPGRTKTALKRLLKQRLCAAGMRGMRWIAKGAKTPLSLRARPNTVGRSAQFWRQSITIGAGCFARGPYRTGYP
jgi:hypothetical protein